ncbi:MAG: carboxylating nicotinate-nucleotide diphosphorylase [Lentisphaerae bacterium]|nr:carboxylating nicotinate-nucleotide diphosphorylase [Lentisphaerota bacterium]
MTMEPPSALEPVAIREIISRALQEDIGTGDVTSLSLVSPDTVIDAVIVARSPCTISGNCVVAEVFRAIDDKIRYDALIPDAEQAAKNDIVAEIYGRAQPILAGERTALNFMQRMSGIATLTRQFVEKANAYGVLILDTRKTTPTLRVFEKYAVRCGGGSNHRMSLDKMILIKDNHRRLWKNGDSSTLNEAVNEARGRFGGLPVEVEVETVAELESALIAEPDWILLDNMTPSLMKECVRVCKGRCKLEASGGISIDNVSEIAASGIDAVSLGCLTHSAPAADLSLEISANA